MDSYDDAIVEFLVNKENIRLALEIADRIEDVKKKLEKKFWETLERKLREKLPSLQDWEIWLSRGESKPGKAIDTHSKSSGGLALEPENPPKQYLYLCIAGDKLWYGLAWAKEVTDQLPLQEVTRLQEWLQAKGYNKSDSWSPAYKYVAVGGNLRTNQTYVRIATDDSLEEELASDLKALFKDMQTMIKDANRAIALAISQGTLTV